MPGLFPSLFVSLESATISLALITLLGVPLAYVLARSPGRLTSLIGLVVLLPLALPPLMSGILLIYLVGPYTFLGQLFGGHLTNSLTGIVLAQTFCAAPFLIVAARSAFGAVDPATLDMAATLGHSELSRFRHVALPLAAPGIRAGMVLAWLRAFGEYGAVIILAYHPFSLPVYTYNQFSGIGLPTTLAPTALALAVAAVVVTLGRITPRRHTARPALVPAPDPPAATTPAPVTFDIDYRVGDVPPCRVAPVRRKQPGDSRSLGVGQVRSPAEPGRTQRLDPRSGLVRRAIGGAHRRRVPSGGLRGPGLLPLPASHRVATPPLRRGRHAGQGRVLARPPSPRRAAGPLPGPDLRRPAPAGRHWHRPCAGRPSSSSSTSRSRRSTRPFDWSSDASSAGCSTTPAWPPCWSPMTPKRRRSSPTRSSSSRTAVRCSRDPTRDLFTRPSSPEVARLLGVANLHRAVVDSDGWIDAQGVRIAASTGELAPATPVLWSIRPERVTILDTGGLPGSFTDVADVGTAVDLFISIATGLEIHARTTERGGFEVGSPCRLEFAERGNQRLAVRAVTVRFGRRALTPGLDQDSAATSIPTFVALTTASAIIPGSSSSSSAASRVINATKRCGPDCISTWAATPSLVTLGHDPAKAIAGRLAPGSVAALLTGEFDGQPSKVRPST